MIALDVFAHAHPPLPDIPALPSMVPMSFSPFVQLDDSVHCWLTAALLMVMSSMPDKTPAVQVIPVTLDFYRFSSPVFSIENSNL